MTLACHRCVCKFGAEGPPGGPCTCSPGFYGNPDTQCDQCPNNAISARGSKYLMQCVCKPGYTGQNGTNCTVCLPGFPYARFFRFSVRSCIRVRFLKQKIKGACMQQVFLSVHQAHLVVITHINTHTHKHTHTHTHINTHTHKHT